MKQFQEEFLDYTQAGFSVQKTEDGSPTLKQDGLNEEMHARKGALSESVYIYKEASDLFFEHNLKASHLEVLSLGLGLGYNEVLSSCSYLQSPCQAELQCFSFEKENALQSLFLKRLQNPQNYRLYWSLFIQERQNLDLDQLVDQTLKFQFLGEFKSQSLSSLKRTPRLVLYDAYSGKTSSELWEESFLDTLLEKCAPGTVLATYAANSNLKRSLKRASFKNFNKKGFAAKRESSLALKE